MWQPLSWFSRSAITKKLTCFFNLPVVAYIRYMDGADETCACALINANGRCGWRCIVRLSSDDVDAQAGLARDSRLGQEHHRRGRRRHHSRRRCVTPRRRHTDSHDSLIIQRVKWRHRIYGHDPIAILWAWLGIMCGVKGRRVIVLFK